MYQASFYLQMLELLHLMILIHPVFFQNLYRMRDIGRYTPLDSISVEKNNVHLDAMDSQDHNNEQCQQVPYILSFVALTYFQTYLNKSPCHDRSYSGWAALLSILNGNPK